MSSYGLSTSSPYGSLYGNLYGAGAGARSAGSGGLRGLRGLGGSGRTLGLTDLSEQELARVRERLLLGAGGQLPPQSKGFLDRLIPDPVESVFGKVGQGIGEIGSALINLPAGLVMTAGAIAGGQGLQAGQHILRQGYEDLRHPLRHPGYTALTVFDLATLGAGAVARGRVGQAMYRSQIAERNAALRERRAERSGTIEAATERAALEQQAQLERRTQDVSFQQRQPSPTEPITPDEPTLSQRVQELEKIVGEREGLGGQMQLDIQDPARRVVTPLEIPRSPGAIDPLQAQRQLGGQVPGQLEMATRLPESQSGVRRLWEAPPQRHPLLTPPIPERGPLSRQYQQRGASAFREVGGTPEQLETLERATPYGSVVGYQPRRGRAPEVSAFTPLEDDAARALLRELEGVPAEGASIRKLQQLLTTAVEGTWRGVLRPKDVTSGQKFLLGQLEKRLEAAGLHVDPTSTPPRLTPPKPGSMPPGEFLRVAREETMPPAAAEVLRREKRVADKERRAIKKETEAEGRAILAEGAGLPQSARQAARELAEQLPDDPALREAESSGRVVVRRKGETPGFEPDKLTPGQEKKLSDLMKKNRGFFAKNPGAEVSLRRDPGLIELWHRDPKAMKRPEVIEGITSKTEGERALFSEAFGERGIPKETLFKHAAARDFPELYRYAESLFGEQPRRNVLSQEAAEALGKYQRARVGGGMSKRKVHAFDRVATEERVIVNTEKGLRRVRQEGDDLVLGEFRATPDDVLTRPNRPVYRLLENGRQITGDWRQRTAVRSGTKDRAGKEIWDPVLPEGVDVPIRIAGRAEAIKALARTWAEKRENLRHSQASTGQVYSVRYGGHDLVSTRDLARKARDRGVTGKAQEDLGAGQARLLAEKQKGRLAAEITPGGSVAEMMQAAHARRLRGQGVEPGGLLPEELEMVRELGPENVPEEIARRLQRTAAAEELQGAATRPAPGEGVTPRGGGTTPSPAAPESPVPKSPKRQAAEPEIEVAKSEPVDTSAPLTQSRTKAVSDLIEDAEMPATGQAARTRRVKTEIEAAETSPLIEAQERGLITADHEAQLARIKKRQGELRKEKQEGRWNEDLAAESKQLSKERQVYAAAQRAAQGKKPTDRDLGATKRQAGRVKESAREAGLSPRPLGVSQRQLAKAGLTPTEAKSLSNKVYRQVKPVVEHAMDAKKPLAEIEGDLKAAIERGGVPSSKLDQVYEFVKRQLRPRLGISAYPIRITDPTVPTYGRIIANTIKAMMERPPPGTYKLIYYDDAEEGLIFDDRGRARGRHIGQGQLVEAGDPSMARLPSGAVQIPLSWSPLVSFLQRKQLDLMRRHPRSRIIGGGRNLEGRVRFEQQLQERIPKSVEQFMEYSADREKRIAAARGRGGETPSTLQEALESPLEGGEWVEAMQRADPITFGNWADAGLQLAAVGILHMKPAYYLPNVLGQIMLMTADHALNPISFFQTRRLQKGLNALPGGEKMSDIRAAAMMEGPYAAFGEAFQHAPEGPGRTRRALRTVERMHRAGAQTYGTGKIRLGDPTVGGRHLLPEQLRYREQRILIGMDRDFRDHHWITEARRHGYDTVDKLEVLHRSVFEPKIISGMDEIANPHYEKFVEISNRAAANAIDYARLGPNEQKIVRRIIMFYPWMKGATRWMAHFYATHPVQGLATTQLGQYGAERNKEIFGTLPSFLEGIIDVSGFPQVDVPAPLNWVMPEQIGGSRDVPGVGKMPQIINPINISPLSTGGEVARATRAALTGEARSAEHVAQFFNPFLSAGIAGSTGIDPFQGGRLPEGAGIPTFVKQLGEGTLSPLTLLDRVKRAEGIASGEVDASRVLYPYSTGEAVGRFAIGATPWALNVPEAQERAAAETRDLAGKRQREVLRHESYGQDVTDEAQRLGISLPERVQNAISQKGDLEGHLAEWQERLGGRSKTTYVDRLQAELDWYVRNNKMPAQRARTILRQFAAASEGAVSSLRTRLKEVYLDRAALNAYKRAFEARGGEWPSGL